MDYTNLGAHKDQISKIGLGSLFKNYDLKNNIKITKLIEKGSQVGINFIDTSPVYGSGEIEKIIGVSTINKRDKFVLATKNLPSQNTYQQIISSAEMSLKRLKTDYIDLFQIHWPNHNISIEETCEALKVLIKAGKIKYVGVCNTTLKDLKKYFQILNDKLASVQNEFNLIETKEYEKLKNFIDSKKITMIGYSPFLNGKFYNGRHQKKILDNLEIKYKRKKSEIILNWICSQSANFVSIPSTLKIRNLISNANALNFSLENSDFRLISKECKTLQKFINPREIHVKKHKSNIYHSLTDAKKNILNLNPSPSDLAKEIRKKNILKPIKLRFLKKNIGKKYLLEDGVLRYWSWLIAYGEEKKIPSLVYEE